MGKKPNPYNKILTILQELHSEYPNQTMAQHLNGALASYKELWSQSDREILFAFEKYRMEKDNNIASDSDVDKIYQDGLHLDTLFIEEDGYEEE
jgi:hypothetical protein